MEIKKITIRIGMKKKIIITVAGVLIVLVGALLLNCYPLFFMKPLNTGIIEGTDIIAVKNNINNIFILEGEDGYIVIDAGTKLETVESSVEDLSIQPEEVTHLFLTHTDYDHTGAVSIFKNAQIYMGIDEKAMINGTVKRNIFQYNKLPKSINQDEIIYLGDEEEVLIGDMKVKCFATPGHTMGSVSYLINENCLFTGDALRLKDNKFILHPFTMDKERAQKSIEKISDVKGENLLVITAHYGYVSIQ